MEEPRRLSAALDSLLAPPAIARQLQPSRLVMQPQTDTTKHWACYEGGYAHGPALASARSAASRRSSGTGAYARGR